MGRRPNRAAKESRDCSTPRCRMVCCKRPARCPAVTAQPDDRDHYRDARGLMGVVGFYARSLSRHDYDVRKHPSFEDFACGLMALAMEKGIWNLEKDEP